MILRNVYSDQRRAEAYAKLEFPGTYYLAYRDLPEIISKHVTGRTRAVDFGSGADSVALTALGQGSRRRATNRERTS